MFSPSAGIVATSVGRSHRCFVVRFVRICGQLNRCNALWGAGQKVQFGGTFGCILLMQVFFHFSRKELC